MDEPQNGYAKKEVKLKEHILYYSIYIKLQKTYP